MFTMGRLLSALALALMPILLAVTADAGSMSHTWVATGGTDNGSCGSTSSPCASFQGAYNNTAANGEITCLNSGSYGAVQIGQSITINCEGAVGTASSINISIVSGAVVLRGLDVDGTGSSLSSTCGITNGEANSSGLVNFLGTAGNLHLEKMKISRATGAGCGVQYLPAYGGTLDIVDCDITEIGSSGVAAGVYVAVPGGGYPPASFTIENSRISGNYFGIIADSTANGGGVIRGVIKNSVVSRNSQNGITASSGGASDVLLIDGTAVANNGNHGLAASGSEAGMLVRNTSVFNNGGGLFTENGGALFSYGNNSVNGNNGKDGSFTGTVGQQ